MAQKRYRVCVPRQYEKDGQTKTHFWQIGTAWPLRERDGMSVDLYTNVIPGKRLVLLVDEPREAGQTDDQPPPADDDLPF